jgi:hypothetical protein
METETLALLVRIGFENIRGLHGERRQEAGQIAAARGGSMKWFFDIRGTSNRSVKQSDAIYETESEAQAAGTEFLKKNKASVMRYNDPNEIFTITTGRK